EGEAPPTDGGAAETASSPLPAAPERSSPPPAPLKANPPARRLAAGRGVDLSILAGTGPGGRIVEADVLAAAERAAAPRDPEIADAVKRVRRHCVLMTGRANASHIGSSLSTADLLAVLYGRFLRF